MSSETTDVDDAENIQDKNAEREARSKEYQRNYYETVLKGKRRFRWSDPAYRRKERERDKDRRSLKRAEAGPARFHAKIKAKRRSKKKARGPRIVLIGKKVVTVYSAGDLAREVGREVRTIRKWLNGGVLPGATCLFNGNNGPRAYFSYEFCLAVYRACLKMSKLDSRFPPGKLKRVVREEFDASNINYVKIQAVT